MTPFQIALYDALPPRRPALKEEIREKLEKDVGLVRHHRLHTDLRALERQKYIRRVKSDGIFIGWARIQEQPRDNDDRGGSIRARSIIADMAMQNGYTVAQMVGPERKRDLAWLRQDAYREVRAKTSLSLPQIGKVFGGRDHTTILHGIRASEARQKDSA